VTHAPRSRRRVLLEYGLTLLLAVAIAYAAEALAVKPFAIPTASMANTVQPGDPPADRPRELPGSTPSAAATSSSLADTARSPCFKRVVGLPGDRLSLSNGRLFVNGQPASQAWVRRLDGRLEPTLPGPDAFLPWSLAHPFVVPAGQYFVMGDNPPTADDSPLLGYRVARPDHRQGLLHLLATAAYEGALAGHCPPRPGRSR